MVNQINFYIIFIFTSIIIYIDLEIRLIKLVFYDENIINIIIKK